MVFSIAMLNYQRVTLTKSQDQTSIAILTTTFPPLVEIIPLFLWIQRKQFPETMIVFATTKNK
jgi:hypothetical protein